MGWGSLIGGVAGSFFGMPALGAGLGGLLDGSPSSGQDAANAQAAANDKTSAQNLAYQKEHNAQVDPLSSTGARGQYAGQMNKLMSGGASGMFEDPVFQSMQKQSMEAMQRKMSSQGQGVGTNDMMAIQSSAYGQANDFFSQQYNRLAQLSNASGGGTSTPNMATSMSPGVAGEFASQTASNQTGLAGMATSGLSSIFGNNNSNSTNNGGQLAAPPTAPDGFDWGTMMQGNQ